MQDTLEYDNDAGIVYASRWDSRYSRFTRAVGNMAELFFAVFDGAEQLALCSSGKTHLVVRGRVLLEGTDWRKGHRGLKVAFTLANHLAV